MRTFTHLVSVIWILINLYVWGVMTASPAVTGLLPDGLSSHYESHRAVLTKVFYRPYVWSLEGG